SARPPPLRGSRHEHQKHRPQGDSLGQSQIWLLAKGHTSTEVAELVALTPRWVNKLARTSARARQRWGIGGGANAGGSRCCRLRIWRRFASLVINQNRRIDRDRAEVRARLLRHLYLADRPVFEHPRGGHAHVLAHPDVRVAVRVAALVALHLRRQHGREEW